MTVVDLDGTLLCGNSFRWFTRYVLRLAVRRRPMAAAELCVLLALRRLRACSHRRLKWHLMKIADIVLSADDYSAFARMLKERINRRVLAALGNEQKIVIASAASDEYVAPFVELMGWRYHVATRRPPSGKYSDYIECRGEMKVKALRRMFPGESITAIYTDHVDDLPLLAASSGRRVLVSPSASTLMTVSLAGLEPELI